MGQEDLNTEGMLATLRRLADSIFAVVENRLALAIVELNLEKYRAIELMIWGGAFVVFGLLSAILVTFTVVVIFWDTARLAVMIAFCLLYLLGAAASFFALRGLIKNWPMPFSDSIAEIKKDRACLQTRKS